ncbi:MAG: hypothetical protein JWM74_5382 [Myxococcaceae bacterium]|nr:hypothetical protein [Myxococcaceae bacterium]
MWSRCKVSRSVVSALALLVSVGATNVAYADDAADIAAARQFGSEGVNLADEGKCKEAIEKLDRAEKLRHAPTTAGRLGECEIEVGRIVAGTERLQRLLREPAVPNPPPAFVTALQRAQQMLDKALPRIAVLHVAVAAPAGTKIALSVDGEKISDVFIDADRPTDPGLHSVQASSPGFYPASTKVALKDSETKRIELKLEPDPNYKVAVAPPAPTPENPTPIAPPPEEPAPSRVPAYAAFGLGGAGIVVGTITGIMALGRKSDATTNCPQSRCVAGSQGEADLSAAKTLGTASTVGFIVGGVGVATGVVLLFTSSSSTPAATRASRPPAPAVRPELGLGYAGVRGTF